MLGDMAERGYSPLTQKIYVRAVTDLVRHYGNRSPEQISVAEAQSYLRLLKQRGASVSMVGNHMAGIRFLFEVTFGKVWQPVSPLRQRMLEDMDMRGFSVKTQM
jgi:site-specific recombinase XerD